MDMVKQKKINDSHGLYHVILPRQCPCRLQLIRPPVTLREGKWRNQSFENYAIYVKGPLTSDTIVRILPRSKITSWEHLKKNVFSKRVCD